MPFITREDGEHFVVPSYRDVITAKSNSQLKKEIEALSQSYGEYITLQKKNQTQYEVAFSPDPGYLLGESIWHHFNRPRDLIYCETIPNTTEAILVIVKDGAVYLDGSFPVDNIVEELVVFLTQQNNFEIYTYGDVPISKEPTEGKFAFEASSVKSFTLLDKPVFPTLPLLKVYQLQLVATVLASHGIGVFPTRKVVMLALTVFIIYLAYVFITSEQVQEVQVQVMQITHEDPYELYYDTLTTPAPEEDMEEFLKVYNLFTAIPGWVPGEITYKDGKATAMMKTKGAQVEDLMDWGKIKNVKVDITAKGIFVIKDISLSSRIRPYNIAVANQVIANLIDRVHEVYPGNVMQVAEFVKKGSVKSTSITMDFQNISPMVFSIIGEKLSGLPIKVQSITMSFSGNKINGQIVIQVVGS